MLQIPKNPFNRLPMRFEWSMHELTHSIDSSEQPAQSASE